MFLYVIFNTVNVFLGVSFWVWCVFDVFVFIAANDVCGHPEPLQAIKKKKHFSYQIFCLFIYNLPPPKKSQHFF